MAALLHAMADSGFPALPAVVISNRADAAGLKIAQGLGVPTTVVDHRPFKGDRAAFDNAIERVLLSHEVDLIAQAGFMRIHDAAYVERWQGRMLNIHPSLLPLFTGLNTHARALEAGVAVHGCTVHEVIPDLDAGPILGQAAVPVVPGDTPEMLAARVLVQEHRLYPKVLRAFAENPDWARRNRVSLLAP